MRIEKKGNMIMAIKEHLIWRIDEIDPKFRDLAYILLNALDEGKNQSQIEDLIFSEISELMEDDEDEVE